MKRVLSLVLILGTCLSTQVTEAKSASEKKAKPESFKKSSKAVQFLKSSRNSYGIWIDPVKWNLTKNFNNDAEFSFSLKGKDAYAFVINEGANIPMEFMTDFIINNFKESSESYSILAVEDRLVNGLPVKYIRADAMTNGNYISFMIYAHSSEKGTVQIYTYSYGNNLIDLEGLLNGLAARK